MLSFWTPLLGDITQQGLSNYSITTVGSGATVNTNGKLGKCYYFDGTTNGYINTNFPTNVGTDDFTISLWVKIPTISSGSYYAICTSKTTTATSVGFGIYWNYSQKKFLWSTADGTNATEIWMADSVDSIVYDKWIHLVMVRNNSDAKKGYFYINGTRYELASVPAIRNIATASYLMIGKCTNGSYPCKMYVNDLRVYVGTALSAKEIRNLSLGMVCHYPLNNNGGGQPNLYNFESAASIWKTGDEELILVDATDDVYGNVLKITTPSSVDSARIYRGVKNVWKADINFTVSFLAKASKTTVLKIERSRTDYAPDVTVGTTWKRYSTVIPCSATTTGGALGIQTSTASADIYLTQIKVELGDKATAYCPGVGDSHYIPLGYDSTTEYDVSGYGNNGTKSETLTYSSDTARYSVSTLFADGLSGKITAPITIGDGTQITISVWMKSLDGSTGTGSYHMPININGSEFEFSIPTTGKFRQGFVISGSRKVADYGSTNLLDKKWHMLSATFDGTNIKRYIDGVLVDTTAASGTLNTGNKNIYIGTYGGSTQYASKNILESDLRIYATALSAEQVAELYNTAVSVANNGTLLGYELVEV